MHSLRDRFNPYRKAIDRAIVLRYLPSRMGNHVLRMMENKMTKEELKSTALKTVAKRVFPGILGVWLLFGSWYTVDPSERANVRRFGVVQYTKPVEPGFHLKLPFIDTVDKIQVSLQTLHIPPFAVTTVDNQKVTLDINFNYTIPAEKVNHIMYEIGRSGNTDIDAQLVPVAKDRVARIFSHQNMVTVNASRSDIQAEIEAAVLKSAETLFGIEPHSLQIAGITPSDAFMASNEAAVKAKNDAVAAQGQRVLIAL